MTGNQRSCTCDQCKNMCRRPCWPTPTEAKRLIEAGFANKLMLDWWSAPDNIYILAPASVGRECKKAPFNPASNWCVFYNNLGLCDLHDKNLKPYEGRVASHDIGTGVHKDVALMWDTKEAKDLVGAWSKEYLEEDDD